MTSACRRELLAAARQVVFFEISPATIARLREAVTEADEMERAYPPLDEDDEEQSDD